MSTLEQLQIIARMDKLIRREATGCPQKFAARLGISMRSLYNYLGLIRDIGAPVDYSKSGRSYRYLRDGKLVIGFRDKEDIFQ